MQDKIIAAIEKALTENLNHTYIGYEINTQEIATEIAAAIAPLVEEVYEAGVNSCSCGECSYCLESGVDSFESFMA